MYGQADLTGENTKGGTQIYAFFRNMLAGVGACYIHTQHVNMVSLNSSGIIVED